MEDKSFPIVNFCNEQDPFRDDLNRTKPRLVLKKKITLYKYSSKYWLVKTSSFYIRQAEELLV